MKLNYFLLIAILITGVSCLDRNTEILPDVSSSQPELPIQNFNRAIQGKNSGGTTISVDIPRGNELPFPCTHASIYAEMRVKNFLYVSPHESNEKQIESGTIGISESEIRSVDNSVECQEINDFLNSNPIYKHPKENVDRTRYHYQTNDFYYVLWVPNKVKLSPISGKSIVVIKKDFSKAWFY